MPKKALKTRRKITQKKSLKKSVVKAPELKIKHSKNPERISPEVDKARSVASYYGFSFLPDLSVENEDIKLAKKFSESHLKNLHPFKDKNDRFGGFLEEKIALLRNFSSKKFAGLGMPVMGHYVGPLKGNPHMKRTPDEETFNLEIIGGNKSIAEAMIIETAFVILRERYPDEELSVEINSVGDKESISKFVRELGNYCKKEINNMPKACRQAVKRDIFALFHCSHNECLEAQDGAPKPMSFLSEANRTHFKEVLEYLESLEIPYSVNHSLIGSRSYCTETIFEIKGNKNGVETTLGIGERYSGLAKKVWGKKDIPAIGAALLIHPHFILKRRGIEKAAKPAKFFFIQFGFDAKLKSLALIEMLRQAKIPVYQSLSKDKLAAQLATAEKMNIPYIIIMGQQEAKDESVVVRKMDNHSQETVSTKELIHYLKKLP